MIILIDFNKDYPLLYNQLRVQWYVLKRPRLFNVFNKHV